MSEKGGALTKGFSESEIETGRSEFFKEMQILDYKYLDIVRENHDLEPFDDSATFGEDMEKRWDHFSKIT